MAGVAAHYHCSVCGKYFTEGKVETTLDALTGTTPSHSFGDWKNDTDKHWKECSCGKKSEEVAHIDTDTNNKCDTCGKDLPVAPPDHEHNFVDGKCECGETDPNYTPGTDTPGTDVPGTDVPGTDKPEDPDDGLSGGAIAGIVAGSVVVLGGGGFALFWFVIKKKSFADLIAVFKKK